eukprot:CAMPEP_0172642104 /NCGR_PEP_ID=MMETSP1068-20121228/230692_1 /TAXON_ID=35684 /ORGANISM="Pseudopedinella elastica, Strain CCMP716" /LENGTH=204 /DNA_ID=CAMNT_0013455847 /DNA_START=79 /DNA_END=690 /DNA_ORIENTATION=+
MNRIFGKKKEVAPPPTLNDATGRIDGNVARLDEKIAKLEGELRRYKEQMKKARGSASTSIKKRAMQTLKQKKMYENQRDQMAAQGFNIDSTRFAIDMVQDQQVAVNALKAAASTLKVEQKKINLGEVEDVHDDMEELFEEMEEINEVMGRSYGLGDDVDESELDSELAMLEDELEGLDEDEAAGMPDYLPSAPSGAVGMAHPPV